MRETASLSAREGGSGAKFRRWTCEIETILAKAAAISGKVQSVVEADLGYALGDHEQLVIAMFQARHPEPLRRDREACPE